MARQSPHFGLRLLEELPAPARAEVIRHWYGMAAPQASAPPRPGLKKCSPRAPQPSNGLSAQLQAFARTIGSVG